MIMGDGGHLKYAHGRLPYNDSQSATHHGLIIERPQPILFGLRIILYSRYIIQQAAIVLKKNTRLGQVFTFPKLKDNDTGTKDM